MSEQYTIRWLTEYENVLHLAMLPHEPDWQVTFDAVQESKALFIERAPESCIFIFDVSAHPDPPDFKVVAKGREIIDEWPKNVECVYMVGLPLFIRPMVKQLAVMFDIKVVLLNTLYAVLHDLEHSNHLN